MSENVTTYERAEELRKAKHYAEAADVFGQLWQDKPNKMIGWRYALCLRHTGQVDQAEQILKFALEQFPDDVFTKKELGWVLYEKELKPAREESDLGRVLHAAREILQLNSDSFALQRVSLVVIKVAKARGRWNVVLEWADKLQADELSAEAPVFDGKRGMSDRETWYLNRARALLELNRFDEARAQAHAGLEVFPGELFLLRTAALARAQSGDVQGGLEEMRALAHHRRADWYVKAELAELEFLAGNHADAYRLMCEALNNPQEDQFKLGYLLILAQIALALDKPEIAAEHVQLAKMIREQEGWSIPDQIQSLERGIQNAFAAKEIIPPALLQDLQELSKQCHRHWREGATIEMERIRRTIKSIPSDRGFTFIKRQDGGEDVFVLVRELPRNLQSGERVEFVLQKSYDQKKNKESVIAKNVQRAK